MSTHPSDQSPQVMSKGIKSTAAKTPKSGNCLEKYFGSPADSDSTKKRKMTTLDLSGNSESPPAKRTEIDESPSNKMTADVDSPTPRQMNKDTTTPSSEKVCKHLDNQLSDMEKRLETSLSTSLSASITASVTAGLKGLISSSLKEALDTMSKKVDEAIEEHPKIVHHSEQIDSLETENLLLKSKVTRMEGEASQFKKRLVSIESRALANNIIVRGIPEDEWEKESTTRHKVSTELKKLTLIQSGDASQPGKRPKKLEIRSRKRVGRYVKDRSRPISTEFVRKEDVEFILSNKTKLNKGVYADKEYPADIEKKRKILRPIYTAAKNSKKYKKRCRMEDDVIVIKGKRYQVDELDKLPKSLKPANVTSRNNQSIYGYFGELNPLSNFFPSPFTYEDQTYHCSEQFIQMKKAELFKDKQAIKRIKNSSSGYQCKMEGNKVKNFDESSWHKKAYQLCLPGVRQKFLSNEVPRQLLTSKTKGKCIVECSKDTTWGCGMSIHNDKCLDTSLWTCQGIMGEMLEEIRRELTGPEEKALPPLPDFRITGTTSSLVNKKSENASSHPNPANSTANAPGKQMDPDNIEPVNMITDSPDDSSTSSSSSDEDSSE